jgi:hypothetical protein
VCSCNFFILERSCVKYSQIVWKPICIGNAELSNKMVVLVLLCGANTIESLLVVLHHRQTLSTALLHSLKTQGESVIKVTEEHLIVRQKRVRH